MWPFWYLIFPITWIYVLRVFISVPKTVIVAKYVSVCVGSFLLNSLTFENLNLVISFLGVCSLDNRVYCIGGTYGPSGTKYCFRLNESDTKWDRIANLQQGIVDK